MEKATVEQRTGCVRKRRAEGRRRITATLPKAALVMVAVVTISALPISAHGRAVMCSSGGSIVAADQ